MEFKALFVLEEDKALDTLWVGTQEEAHRTACTATVGKIVLKSRKAT